MSTERGAPRPKSLRGVIFDLGGTLIDFHPGGDWRDMEHLGAVGWRAFLLAHGYDMPDEETVKAVVWEQMFEGWLSIGQGRDEELTLANQLRLVAKRLGLALAPEDAALAEAAFVGAVQEQVRPIDGAAEILCALKSRGLRLGLISNTMWPGVYHRQDLARFGLLEPFGALFFSADEAAWKPEPEIFRRALGALDLAPEEAAFVGDSRLMDVMGAQEAGLRGVWVECHDPWMAEGVQISPDATIRHLRELLPVVDAWHDNQAQTRRTRQQ
jgi:putative hydrolase of the HAD superfamily